MTKEELKKLELNEQIRVDNKNFPEDIIITRVPNGWVYTICVLGHDMGGSTFVPEIGDK